VDGDRPALRGVLDGVVHEVRQHLGDPVAIRLDGQAGGRGELDLAIGVLALGPRDDREQLLDEVHRLRFHGDAAPAVDTADV